VLLNKGDGSFQAARSYRAGRDPLSVAIGDLNGDRRRDLAIANLVASSVSVLVNRGDGTFRAKRDYPTGRGPLSVVIGDLNGDGKPDLVTAHSYANALARLFPKVSVLANRGGGTFQAKLDYAIPRGLPSSVAIGDLNGDRRPDLVTANPGDGTGNLGKNKSVSVLLNTPGLCTVQDVKGETLPAAKRTIAHANCRVGKIRRVYSGGIKGVRVISQKPTFGAVLRGGGKVNLVVCCGRRHS
jgi:FG-GAP-like repeat/FG-GAP repeat/PASTA domain